MSLEEIDESSGDRKRRKMTAIEKYEGMSKRYKLHYLRMKKARGELLSPYESGQLNVLERENVG